MVLPQNKRVLIDANVLLNASFVEDCIARQALDGLKANSYSLLCDEITYAEAIATLDGLRNRLVYDPRPIFETALRSLGVMFVPPGDPNTPSPTRRHDRHIPRAASDHSTWIITDDLELYLDLRSAGYEVRNSFELQFDFPTVSKVHAPARIKALSYSRKSWTMLWLTPGGWAQGPPHPSKYTACHLPPFVWLHYDALTKEWVAKFEFCKLTIHTPFALTADVPVAVAVVLDASRTPGKLVLCVGSPAGGRQYRSTIFSGIMPPRPNAFTLGHLSDSHENENSWHWNGSIRTLQTGDRFISSRMWKLLCSTQDMMLHPQLDILTPALLVLNNLVHRQVTAARMSEL